MFHCLCINPKCPNPERHGDEQPCQMCGSDLLLNQRYRVTKILHESEGSITKIYEIIDTQDNNKVKVLKALYSRTEEVISRFNREADVLISLSIDGLPRVEKEGFFHVEFPSNSVPAYCLVMEKIEGMNLEEWVTNTEHQKLDEPQALNWLKQLTIILDELHGEGFFHRDIKPANIMLRQWDSKLILIDLGAVRLISPGILEGNSATIIGTPGYMAPEQKIGKPNPQSDFYGLGLTFVHLLTGQHPNLLPQDQQYKLIWRNQAPLLSDNFVKLIDSLMEKDSKKRPQKTGEILNKIKKLEEQLEKQGKKSSLLKKIIGFSALLIAGLLILLVNKSPTIKTDDPNQNHSPDNDVCHYRKDGKLDESALAKDAKDAIDRIVKAKNNSDSDNINNNSLILTPRQDNCKITVTVVGDAIISQELETELKTVILENINPKAKELVKIDIQPY